jgi:hypothetical protein
VVDQWKVGGGGGGGAVEVTKRGEGVPLIGTTETAVTQTLAIVFPRTLCTQTPAAIIPATFIVIAIWSITYRAQREGERGNMREYR